MEVSSLKNIKLGKNFRARKVKKPPLKNVLYFRKQSFLAPSLKRLLIFQEGTYKARKTNKIPSKEIFYILLTESFLMLFRCVLNTALLFCVSKA